MSSLLYDEISVHGCRKVNARDDMSYKGTAEWVKHNEKRNKQEQIQNFHIKGWGVRKIHFKRTEFKKFCFRLNCQFWLYFTVSMSVLSCNTDIVILKFCSENFEIILNLGVNLAQSSDSLPSFGFTFLSFLFFFNNFQ